jgi:Tfp pilus assembly protein PilZ
MVNRSDEQHLWHAQSVNRALYSFNMKDFSALHGEWIASGRSHSGIIVVSQQRYSIGEQLRRLLHLLSRVSAEEIRSRIEYLSAWGH